MSRILIKSGNAERAAAFVKTHDALDIVTITALQYVVLNRGTTAQVIEFAQYADGADVRAIQRFVINHGTGAETKHFASTIPGVDVELVNASLPIKFEVDSWLVKA